jgi:hypothetical protein
MIPVREGYSPTNELGEKGVDNTDGHLSFVETGEVGVAAHSRDNVFLHARTHKT